MNQAGPTQMPRRGMVQGIVFYPSDNLRTRSVEVPEELVPSGALHELAQNMVATMLMTGGVGISAIQIGIPWRVIAIGVSHDGERLGEDQIRVMVNPSVVRLSSRSVNMKEGCLSFPTILETITRPESVDVEYLTPHGDKKTISASGWEARCILHEVDHLEGVLFIDKMSRLSRRIALSQSRKLRTRIDRDARSSRRALKEDPASLVTSTSDAPSGQ